MDSQEVDAAVLFIQYLEGELFFPLYHGSLRTAWAAGSETKLYNAGTHTRRHPVKLCTDAMEIRKYHFCDPRHHEMAVFHSRSSVEPEPD